MRPRGWPRVAAVWSKAVGGSGMVEGGRATAAMEQLGGEGEVDGKDLAKF